MTQAPSVDQTLPTLRPSSALPSPRSSGVGLDEGNLDIAGRSDIGRERRRNEDQFVVAQLGRAIRVDQTSVDGVPHELRVLPQGVLLIVADGMGGHGHGDLASAVTVDALLASVPIPASGNGPRLAIGAEAYRRSFEHCQARVEEVASRKGLSALHIGTTLTVAHVDWPELAIAHVGDSRCYLLRNGLLLRITHDHTMGQALRAQGASDEVAERFDHALVNAVGGDAQQPAPEVAEQHLERGDRLLLCTDGLTAELSDELIARVLGTAASSAEACETLVRLANEAGGSDNITAVVATCR